MNIHTRNKAKRDEELEAMRYGHDNIMQVAAKHGLPETLTHYGVVLALSDKIAQLSGKEKKW